MNLTRERGERKVHRATELTQKLASSNEGATIANEVSAVLSSLMTLALTIDECQGEMYNLSNLKSSLGLRLQHTDRKTFEMEVLVMDGKLPIIDGIKWHVYFTQGGPRYAQPLCPQHDIRLKPSKVSIYDNRLRRSRQQNADEVTKLKCEDGQHFFEIPRTFEAQRDFVIDKVDAINRFSKMQVINLDDTVIPVGKEELKDSDYWVLAKVTKSKSGDRLIVWAGNRSKKQKTQLFVEPELKRLSFDHNDDHPTEVFSKLEATFADGVTSKIEKNK